MPAAGAAEESAERQPRGGAGENGVCNPASAKKVLDANIRVATALPCRVSMYEDGKEVLLGTLKPTMMIRMFGDPALEDTAREVETAIEAIIREAAR